MPANWTRLKREEANNVLARLGDHPDAVIFSRDTTDVSLHALPFYASHKLYKIVNYATMPVFSILYLSDGNSFVTLDGTAAPIYTVNEKDPVRLSETNVIPYLDFFFGSVQGSEGDVFLIRDPRKMPAMSSLTEKQQQSIVSNFKPLRVCATEGGLSVAGTLYYGGALIAATIHVTPDGKLSFGEQSLLLSGIHFPPGPAYGQHAWLEGTYDDANTKAG